jgi:hypothetical protein
MFPAMKYALENGINECVKFFIYDLANPLFHDFSPKFFVSDIVQSNLKYKEVLKLSGYSKGKVYNILNNETMKVHEEHMTPNSIFKEKILEYDNSVDFEDFVRKNYAIAIITKEENNKLDKGGYKSNRANLKEAFFAYEQMGIRLNEIKFGHLNQ